MFGNLHNSVESLLLILICQQTPQTNPEFQEKVLVSQRTPTFEFLSNTWQFLGYQ